MLTIALTGNVASGKTLVTNIWAEAGVPVVRADELAREAVAPGTDGLARVIQRFGPDYLREDGSLDRAKVRDRVFRSAEELRALESILHPLIGTLRQDWISTRRKEGATLAVVEIPLLFEVGLEGDFEVIVLVVAPSKERLRRLMEDRGLEREEASRMMAAQLPTPEKRSNSDYVLENAGTVDDLRIRSLALLDLLKARARKGAIP